MGGNGTIREGIKPSNSPLPAVLIPDSLPAVVDSETRRQKEAGKARGSRRTSKSCQWRQSSGNIKVGFNNALRSDALSVLLCSAAGFPLGGCSSLASSDAHMCSPCVRLTARIKPRGASWELGENEFSPLDPDRLLFSVFASRQRASPCC